MKRAPLITVGLVALLFTAAASAAPATFVFNTSGFDFTDYSLTSGYLGFAMNGNQLQVNLASGGPVSAIPSITLWVPGPTTNAVGATVYPTLANIQDITTTSNGAETTSFTVTHDGASLSSVVNAYVKALQNLGFKATEQSSTDGNIVVYDFAMNGAQYRAVFHRVGANVTAHLSGANVA